MAQAAPDLDCLVIGAGVVGLAIARALARAGRDVVVAEAEKIIGTGISSRNSEVIHAGLYYPPGSLKAATCVRGKALLYDFCQSHGVPYARLGKLIVATDPDEIATLKTIQDRGRANGVHDLRLLTAAEARTLEPSLTCQAALLSPSTGIVDSHALMLACQGDAEAAGAMIAFHSPVLGGRRTATGVEVTIGGAHAAVLTARLVINCAGLDAPALSENMTGLNPLSRPTAYLAKGKYYALSGRAPFSHLIYPVPQPGGLGVHLTMDLAGQARFGPDVEWTQERDYHVDPARADQFYGAVRRYWPDLPDNALVPDYAGIRPKISAPGSPAADFLIHGPAETNIPGYIALYGIESPGLTAALALAEHVTSRVTS